MKRAETWAKVFDGNSLVTLRKASVRYDAEKDSPRIKAKVLYVLSRTDKLFPPSIAPGVMAKLKAAGVNADYFEIDSEFGHSASGPDNAKWAPRVQDLHGRPGEAQLARDGLNSIRRAGLPPGRRESTGVHSACGRSMPMASAFSARSSTSSRHPHPPEKTLYPESLKGRAQAAGGRFETVATWRIIMRATLHQGASNTYYGQWNARIIGQTQAN